MWCVLVDTYHGNFYLFFLLLLFFLFFFLLLLLFVLFFFFLGGGVMASLQLIIKTDNLILTYIEHMHVVCFG